MSVVVSPDITEVPELSSADLGVLAEVFKVLEGSGVADRFGIALLHNHNDELGIEGVLVERSGEPGTVVTRRETGTVHGRPTEWRLTADGPVAQKICVGNHGGDPGNN